MAHPVLRILNGNDLAELVRAERSDGQLLDRFVHQRDEEAFAAVVRRHGPMVLAVCRRLLRNPADADDAFQAAFLVLARKAGSLSTRGLLAPWLHGVAFNTARRLRRANGRRANRERPLAELPEPVAASVEVSDELLAILDEELTRLPERYRATIVLCDLEGLTRKEAAQQLQCPEGTVAGRLARARALLAARLADRGVAPSAGLLAALLTDSSTRAMTVTQINGVMRAVFTGAVSRRVALTVERVVAAMLIQKMKSLAIALLVIGVVTAATAGLFRASANAEADPEAPPRAKLATAEPRQPAGEVRELTVIPLRKLEAEAAAKVITETFKGKGVTVAAVAGEQTLLVYASAKQIRDVRDLLAKLGDESSVNKAAVLRLKTVECTEAAKMLQDVFNGTKPANRSSRLTILAVPDDNSLLVFGSPTDVLKARQLVVEHMDAPPAAKSEKPLKHDEKRFSMRFQNVSWDDVLDWYSKTTGLTPILTVKPKGQFTFLPPRADKKYTLAEITDILNESMGSQKMILIRRQVTFFIHPADEKIDSILVPRIELSELPTRGKTELVQVLIPLKSLNAPETAPEIQRLLSPFGTVSPLSKANTLVVLDTAKNVSRIYKTIEDIEGQGGGDHLIHVCKYRKAEEVANHLMTLLSNKPADGNLIGMRLFEDEKANTVVIIASAKDIALAKKIIEAFDKPKKAGKP